MAAVTVTITNTNPIRTMLPRATVLLQKSIDGLTYSTVKADGTVVTPGIPLWFVEGFLMAPADPVPLMDRPKGASVQS